MKLNDLYKELAAARKAREFSMDQTEDDYYKSVINSCQEEIAKQEEVRDDIEVEEVFLDPERLGPDAENRLFHDN